MIQVGIWCNLPMPCPVPLPSRAAARVHGQANGIVIVHIRDDALGTGFRMASTRS